MSVNPEINFVLADLDGTVVLPEAQSASSAVLQAVAQAKEQGLTFAAVTGRPYWMAKDLLKHIGFDGPCVFDGGAIIMNPKTEEILWSKTIPPETVMQAVSTLLPHAHLIEYGAGKGLLPKDVNLQAIHKPSLSVWASVPAELAADLVDKLSTLPETITHANNGPGGDFTKTGIQVTHFQADKEHAVRQLLTILNVKKENTAAFGDGNNDLPLFKSAASKYAMGNASDQLKAAADFVLGSVQEDGFAQGIHILLRNLK